MGEKNKGFERTPERQQGHAAHTLSAAGSQRGLGKRAGSLRRLALSGRRARVMASNTHIAELLKAEGEAQNTVTQARKEKTDLLRQATAEADREVQAYRQQLESQYQAMLQQGGVDTQGALVRLNQETDRTIAEMRQKVQQKSQQVASILVNHVKKT